MRTLFPVLNSFCEASMPTSVLEAGSGHNELTWPPQGAAGGTRTGFSSNLFLNPHLRTSFCC